ncbi:PREDICTED: post-GPI attachment to proteins factor 2 isoform X2 [Drosophila arizonae]|uniref:Post-GPI attachment to proteins factor 2 isoform X2 n=1 Tax=Drosophila arizonae TaxID=7263 RepID=A0ABM1NTJ7_DROAR|nr:PREDICTED: post-GPI attachment to proteins factor 2 isoform X2 [Drosophila arizonae]
MLPTYERLNDPKRVFFHITFARLALTALSLPLSAFCFCVVWSLVFDFARSTFTHCDVANYLPSVSAAIGNYEPQKTVWRLAIILHLPLRLTVTRMYLEYYREHIKRNRRMFGILACTLNVIENFALFCLSLWTSADNYEIHRNSFVVFIACIYTFFALFEYIVVLTNMGFHMTAYWDFHSFSIHCDTRNGLHIIRY